MLAKKARGTDAQKVGYVANLLGMSDFEIFSLAYQAWYSKTPGEAQLECHFSPYLSEGQVPYWVRSYVGCILDQHPQAPRQLRRRDWPQRSCRSLALLLIFAVVLLRSMAG